jgi:hypothetical protein
MAGKEFYVGAQDDDNALTGQANAISRLFRRWIVRARLLTRWHGTLLSNLRSTFLAINIVTRRDQKV